MKNFKLPTIGIGSVNLGLPKDAISGTVPAWLVLTTVAALSAAKLVVSHLNNKREWETKERIAKLKAIGRTNCPKDSPGSTTPGTTSYDKTSLSNDNIPDWVDGGTIEDKKVASSLMGQSGGLILVKGREGSGKSTVVNQLLVEACEGKSSNLFPNCEEYSDSQWTAFLYASEAAPKFQSNFGGKLKELKGRFKALVNNFNFRDVDVALNHIRKSLMTVDGNCAMGIDNITDMFPNITNAQIQRFIEGLKAIRREMNEQGREITFIVVTHANRVTDEASGSSLWQNLFEVVISIQEDKKHKDNGDYKILKVEKSRFGAQTSTPIHREMTKYMRFECYTEEETVSTMGDDDTISEDPTERLPVTDDVEDFFASIHIPNQYSYGQIYKDYKDKYQINKRDDVRNAIERSKKRADKAA